MDRLSFQTQTMSLLSQDTEAQDLVSSGPPEPKTRSTQVGNVNVNQRMCM